MMNKTNRAGRSGVGLLCVCLAAAATCGLSFAEEQPGERSAEIARLIADLDTPSFQRREMAMRRLLEMDESAIEPLQEAGRRGSAEVRSRVRFILHSLRLEPLRGGFAALTKKPDSELDLVRGMWLISRILNPTVRFEDLDRQIDAMAARVRLRLGADVDPRTVEPRKLVAAMRVVLFEEYKLTGAVEDYDNPANSSLEKVLVQRKGLPIVLSQIAVAVAERLKAPLVGLPAPGRYLLKYDGAQAPKGFPSDDLVIDPFGDWQLLEAEDFARRFPGLDPKSIVVGKRRDVLTRMLNNLESDLIGRGDLDTARIAAECRAML